MKIYRGFEDKRLRPAARSVAIGVFDGVHRGHQKILRTALATAARRGFGAAVVTFDPDPVRVLYPRRAHPILMSLSHRLRFFEKLGMAEAVVARFDKKFSRITREAFLEKILIRRLGMKALAVGHNFRFGRLGLGDADFLEERSKALGFRLALVPALKEGRRVISSTRIRRLIESGHLDRAAQMLGRPVSVYGTVVPGRARGRGLGFPTANLDPHHETLPPPGVYAAWGLLDGSRLKGVVHIGEKPTFRDRRSGLEVHFLDFEGNVYGQEIELFFAARLRAIRRFADPRELTRAIAKDVQKASRLLSYFPLQSRHLHV